MLTSGLLYLCLNLVCKEVFLQGGILLKIAFVLPRISSVPIGGYKMVYEYANKLSNDGFDVAIFYDNSLVMDKYKIPEFIKRFLISKRTERSPVWYELNSNIEKKSSRDKNLDSFFASVDIAIATGAGTVNLVKNFFKKSKKVYFIQDFEADKTGESWSNSAEEVYNTYNAGLINITVSKWLKEIVDQKSDRETIYVRNPLDINKYKVLTPINKRNQNTIGMLYHDRPRKGCKYTFEAIKRVRDKFPNVRLIMFGACPPPKNLPTWITYYENASQEQVIQIYNSISIFASGPVKEGFGLTSLEAMACGTALVSSDNLGAMEYAVDGKNALLSPIKDVESMEVNIERLLEDDKKRIELASEGVKTASNYSWSKAYSDFKEAILLE